MTCEMLISWENDKLKRPPLGKSLYMVLNVCFQCSEFLNSDQIPSLSASKNNVFRIRSFDSPPQPRGDSLFFALFFWALSTFMFAYSTICPLSSCHFFNCPPPPLFGHQFVLRLNHRRRPTRRHQNILVFSVRALLSFFSNSFLCVDWQRHFCHI